MLLHNYFLKEQKSKEARYDFSPDKPKIEECIFNLYIAYDINYIFVLTHKNKTCFSSLHQSKCYILYHAHLEKNLIEHEQQIFIEAH